MTEMEPTMFSCLVAGAAHNDPSRPKFPRTQPGTVTSKRERNRTA